MGGWLIYLLVAVMLVGAAYGLLSTLSVLGRSALRSNMQGVGIVGNRARYAWAYCGR